MQNANIFGECISACCRVHLVILACVLIGIAGCTGPDRSVPHTDDHGKWTVTHSEEGATAPVFTHAVSRQYKQPGVATLGALDEIQIELVGVADSLRRVQVQLDGKISYGPVNGLRVGGKTLAEAITVLEQALAQWYRYPRVMTTLLESRSQFATVLGRVHTPGMVRLRGNERVLDLLSAAGGLATSRFSGSTEELADLSGAVYVRDGKHLDIDLVRLVKRGDLRHNILVQSHDYLYIPSSLSREVYVLGAVGLAQTVGYKDGLSLLEALANAKGMLPQAQLHRVLVQRRSGGDIRVATFDVDKILVGKRHDLALEPGDVIFVPGDTSEHPSKLWDAFRRGTATGFGSVVGSRPPAGR